MIKWLKLFLGFLLIGVFIFGLLPLLFELPPLKQIEEFSKARNLDNGALFYTESEEGKAAIFKLENRK